MITIEPPQEVQISVPLNNLISYINKQYLKMEIEKGDTIFQATKEAFNLPSAVLIDLLKKDRLLKKDGNRL